MDPGVEAIRIAKSWQFPPGDHQGLLHGIFGSTDVPEDPVGNREEAIRRRAGQDGECLPVPLSRELHEIAIHHVTVRDCAQAGRVPWCLSRFGRVAFNIRPFRLTPDRRLVMAGGAAA